jgi:hypothetical protein
VPGLGLDFLLEMRERTLPAPSTHCKSAAHAATCWLMRRFETRVALVAWLMGAATLGCDSFAGASKKSYDNTGTVCLTLVSDSLQIEVRFPTCLSSSCDRALPTSCEATLSDGVIALTSHGASESTGETACTDDCGSLTATCTLPTPLEPGDYILNHGNDSAQVTVSTTQTCAFAR